MISAPEGHRTVPLTNHSASDVLRPVAAVWLRGILADDYGVRPEDMEWVQGGLEEPGRVPFEPAEPPGVRVGFASPDRSLAQMLAAGEIDALVTARTPSTFDRRGGPVRRLFADPWAVERDYVARTGVFPIMHTLVIKREVLDADPWVASTLFKAFEAAKALALDDLTQTSALPVSLPFLVQHAYETTALMGDDFWPYGLEPNRRTLETFVRAVGWRSRSGGPSSTVRGSRCSPRLWRGT